MSAVVGNIFKKWLQDFVSFGNHYMYTQRHSPRELQACSKAFLSWFLHYFAFSLIKQTKSVHVKLRWDTHAIHLTWQVCIHPPAPHNTAMAVVGITHNNNLGVITKQARQREEKAQLDLLCLAPLVSVSFPFYTCLLPLSQQLLTCIRRIWSTIGPNDSHLIPFISTRARNKTTLASYPGLPMVFFMRKCLKIMGRPEYKANNTFSIKVQ